MDDQLIDDLIQSDVIISKTIEEGNKSIETSVDDILSSVMSSSAKNIEKEVLNQSVKQAQSVKESLTGSMNNNVTIPEIAELESSKNENAVSEKTLSSLNNVMSNLEGVLKDMNTNQQTATTKTTTTEPTELTSTVIAEQEGTKTTIEKTPQEFDIDKLSNLVKDFKTISTFDWSAKWLSNVEKIAKEVGNIKDELKSLPEESKINLGVDEESIENVEKGLEKVKENISSEGGAEGKGTNEESTSGMSVPFLDGFNSFLQKLIGGSSENIPMEEEQPAPLEFMEMPESREISFGQENNFVFGEEEFGGASAPTTLRENPQNINQEAPTTRVQERESAPLELMEIPESREISFGQENNFVFGEEEFGGASAPTTLRENPQEAPTTRVEENRPTELNQPILAESKASGETSISEEEFDLEEEAFKETPPPPPPPRSSTDSGKSIAELFKMAYAYKLEPEEEEEEGLSEEDKLLSSVTNPKLPTEKEIKGGAETKVESTGEPPLIESLEGLMPTEGSMPMPPTTVPLTAASTGTISAVEMPPVQAGMPTESPLGFKSMRIEDIAKEASKMPPSPAEKSMRIEAMPPGELGMPPMESPLGFKSMRIEDIAKEASKMPPSPAEKSMRIEAMPPGMAEMPTESPFGFKSMRIEDIAKEASKMPPSLAEKSMRIEAMPPGELGMPPMESPFGFKSMRIEDIAKEAETREKERGSTLNLAQPPLEAPMGLEGMGEMEGMPLPPPIPMAEGMIPPMLPNMMSDMFNMSMPPQQAVGTKEIARPQQNLGAKLNETIPFGADLLGMPPMPPMEKEGEGRSVSLESMGMLEIPDLFEFIGGDQMPPETMKGISNKPEMPPMLNTGMEDILIKNQSQKSPELSSAISKIKNVETESAKSAVAESEAMMGEVNLEPLGEKLSSSIDNLGSSMSSEKTPSESSTGEGSMSGDVMSNLTSVLQRIEEKLGGQPAEQGAGQPSVSAGGGGGISEAQARIIGRQIANELKNSLAKLYN